MKGIVNLAQELDAQIVCEGVETDRDVELMQEIGAYVATKKSIPGTRPVCS